MNLLLSTLSCIFGLVPLNRMHHNSNSVFDYLMVICVPLCYLGTYGLTTFSGFAVYHLHICGSICSLANKLLIHLGCALYLTMCFFTLYRRKEFFILFNKKLKKIDDTIDMCHKKSRNKHNVEMTPRLYYITWMLIVIIIGYTLIYDIIEMSKYFKEYFFIANMTVTFPFFVGCIVQGQFIHYVSIITTRSTDLNNLFNKIKQECEEKNHTTEIFYNESKNISFIDGKLMLNRRKINRKFAPEIDFFAKNKTEKTDADLSDVSTIESSSFEKILPALFKLHDQILSLSCLTNASFAPQCVPYMAVCFVIIIYGIVMDTKIIIVAAGKNPLVDYVVQIYFIWSLAMMFVAYLVLRLCYNANGFSKQSAMIIHEIMQNKPIFMLSNDSYYNKMRSFTLQFLHWEEYFQFNGIGLFILDYTFIFTAISTATSYLIVLLQLDMTPILKSEGLL